MASIPKVADKGEEFTLSDGYYVNKDDTIYIKSSNKNYKLFKPKKPKKYVSKI